LHYRDEGKAAKARELIHAACAIGDAPPPKTELIYEVIE
jgi:hypothetical protein